tara:strand:+ start:414 stop:605 length:192 start_codon:yes stop_codon:yes gene_type:complete
MKTTKTEMKLYKLECLNTDGDIEENGYYLNRENAELVKTKMDGYKILTKYGIKQNIVEIETED